MKHLMIITLMLLGINAANAQILDNQNACDVEVIAACYDITTCTVSNMGAPVTIASGTVGSLPTPASACTGNNRLVYIVSYAGCPGSATYVSEHPMVYCAPTITPDGMLGGPCGSCHIGAPVTWMSPTDLIVGP